jgi:hypothetical protein
MLRCDLLAWILIVTVVALDVSYLKVSKKYRVKTQMRKRPGYEKYGIIGSILM